jgi:hypothetical protein
MCVEQYNIPQPVLNRLIPVDIYRTYRLYKWRFGNFLFVEIACHVRRKDYDQQQRYSFKNKHIKSNTK